MASIPLEAIGSAALFQLDVAAKEWTGLIAYWLMGRTDALFPAPMAREGGGGVLLQERRIGLR
jgi:hypothetical protein